MKKTYPYETPDSPSEAVAVMTEFVRMTESGAGAISETFGAVTSRNSAETFRASGTLMTQVADEETQSPEKPAKPHPGAGVALSVTVRGSQKTSSPLTLH